MPQFVRRGRRLIMDFAISHRMPENLVLKAWMAMTLGLASHQMSNLEAPNQALRNKRTRVDRRNILIGQITEGIRCLQANSWRRLFKGEPCALKSDHRSRSGGTYTLPEHREAYAMILATK